MAQEKMHGVWSSPWTFILAATGSAVGLGNIWKFPYITGENGGGAFVLIYLLCIALIGIPVMAAEVCLGKSSRLSPINAMRALAYKYRAHPGWELVGWSGVLAGLLILSFYSVIAGWALHYVFISLSGSFDGASSEVVNGIFDQLLARPGILILWHSIFMVLTVGVVIAGVTKGLAMVARILMPLLFGMLLVLLIYSFSQGDTAKAIDFMFAFRLENLSKEGVLVAMGHAFFTLSLGMGAIMAYGAYMPEQSSIGKTVLAVGFLDTFIALVAGLAIFPIVFANGLEPGSGPGLLFVSLPVAFGAMPGGLIFGTLFFILVVVAAWSSSVSLIEPGIAWLVESRNMSRLKANIILGSLVWFLGLATVLSFNYWADFKPFFFLHKTPFDFIDFLTSQIMLPLGGLFIALFVAWKIDRKTVQTLMGGSEHFALDLWLVVLRWLSPLLVMVVLIYELIKPLL